MRTIIVRYVVFVLLVLAWMPAGTRAQFVALETENQRLIYNEFTQAFLADHVARCFENAMWFYRGI